MTMKAEITHYHHIPLMEKMMLSGWMGPVAYFAATKVIKEREEKKEDE